MQSSRDEKLELFSLLEERDRRIAAEAIDCSSLTRLQANNFYREVLESKNRAAQIKLCKSDLFFLLTVILNRKDADRDFLYDRCREVQANPNGYLDLWSRDHYKSSILTFALSIQDILRDPEVTIAIFSHTRPTAKGFLDQIKREFETNQTLQNLFPDVLYTKPQVEAPKWSLDSGIIVKRKTNPKESTVEAWGLIDGQPTGKHFRIRVYDDVVTRESVTTPDQIRKTTEAWELSQNLGTQNGGISRHIGTRYHINDTYRAIMDRGSVTPRIYTATIDGKVDGEPVLLSKEALSVKRRDMGPYTFSCFPAASPVLMADWTDRPIEDIKVGDEVVGYTMPIGSKTKLSRSKVVAVNSRTAKVIEATFESGRVVRCTPDHKWYTGRRGKDSGGTDDHKTYVPLGFKKDELKALVSVYDPRKVDGPCDPREAGWLSGFFDGEGTTSANTIRFYQTSSKNRIVCDRLERSLTALGYDYGMVEITRTNPKWAPSRDYFIRGGREEKIRFLRQCKPTRGNRIIKSLFDSGTRNFGKRYRDKMVSIKEIGDQKVFNIQTEIGNYICYGYATKNCQMLQDPVADRAMSFKEEWPKYYTQLGDYSKWNLYLIADPASAKKATSDYTSMWVIGLAPDNNYYILDGIRDRLSLTQRAAKLFEFHRKYLPKNVGYERYGMQADIEHIRYEMEHRNYRFNIIELGGTMAKEDRIKRLIPAFEQGRIYFPKALPYVTYEGANRDLIREFIVDEYSAFPVCVHDDMLDCLARILDPNLSAEFPKSTPTSKPKSHYQSSQSTGWMG